MFMFLVIATIDPHNFGRTFHRRKQFQLLRVDFLVTILHSPTFFLVHVCFLVECQGCRPYSVYHAKRQYDVFVSTHPPTFEKFRRNQIFFCCKTSYIGTLANRTTAKGLPITPKYHYSTKIENITIKITKSFISFHKWQSKLLH